MDFVAEFVDAVEAAVRTRVEAGDVITVVGKLFARREPRRFADDLVALDHEPRAIGMDDDPFSAKERDAAIGCVVDRDEIHERMRFVRGQTRSAMMIAEFIEAGGEAGQFARAGHDEKESWESVRGKRHLGTSGQARTNRR